VPQKLRERPVARERKATLARPPYRQEGRADGLDEAQEVEARDDHAGGDERRGEIALGGEEADRRDRPEAGRRGEPPDRHAVPMMAPAPRKHDACDHLGGYPVGVEAGCLWMPYDEARGNAAAPTATSMWVRKPAVCS